MSVLWVSCLLVVFSCCHSQTYNTKYDNIDVDNLLSNQRVLDNYIKCILDITTRCSPEGREFKKNIPEAIRTNCAKCSPAQKRIVRKTASFIMKNRPGDWQKIQQKFDPKGTYLESFGRFLEEN